MMQDPDEYLFSTGSGSDVRRNHIHTLVKQVEMLTPDHVLTQEPEAIVARIVASGSVTVPALDRDNISFSRSERTSSGHDNWGDRYERKRPVVVFEVPFTGERELFKLRPSTFTTNAPRAEIASNALRITVSDSGDPAAIKGEIDSVLEKVDQYLGWHRELWAGLDEEMGREVRQRLLARREMLEKQRQSDASLEGLGFKPKR